MIEIDWLTALIGSHAAPISLDQMIVRALIIFFYGVLMLRLSTPRMFGGHATPIDIVLSIIIGSNLSRTLTGSAPFVEVMVTTTLLVVLHALLSWAAARWRPLANVVKGSAEVLVKDGRVFDANMHAHAIGRRDLREAIRDAGGRGIDQVELATLERGGDINVVLKE